jgi:hypothetical protein
MVESLIPTIGTPLYPSSCWQFKWYVRLPYLVGCASTNNSARNHAKSLGFSRSFPPVDACGEKKRSSSRGAAHSGAQSRLTWPRLLVKRRVLSGTAQMRGERTDRRFHPRKPRSPAAQPGQVGRQSTCGPRETQEKICLGARDFSGAPRGPVAVGVRYTRTASAVMALVLNFCGWINRRRAFHVQRTSRPVRARGRVSGFESTYASVVGLQGYAIGNYHLAGWLCLLGRNLWAQQNEANGKSHPGIC